MDDALKPTSGIDLALSLSSVSVQGLVVMKMDRTMTKRSRSLSSSAFYGRQGAWRGVNDWCREHGFSEASYYLWRSKLGGLVVSDTKRLKGLATTQTESMWDSSRASALEIFTSGKGLHMLTLD